MAELSIRPARPGEAALVLGFVRELAAYEKLTHEVDASEAMIVRVTLLGRDAKIELHAASGAEIVALLTREQFEDAGYWRGQNVWVQPRRERVFETTAA